MKELKTNIIVNNIGTEIYLCEDVETLTKELELELIRAWKDGELILDEEDLEIYNVSGIF